MHHFEAGLPLRCGPIGSKVSLRSMRRMQHVCGEPDCRRAKHSEQIWGVGQCQSPGAPPMAVDSKNILDCFDSMEASAGRIQTQLQLSSSGSEYHAIFSLRAAPPTREGGVRLRLAPDTLIPCLSPLYRGVTFKTEQEHGNE